MDQTARFALPFLSPGQIQKEYSHNEALQRIDMVMCAVVEEAPTNDPPPYPLPGDCYLVGEEPTGEWSGHDGSLAGFSEGGWRFVAPFEGMRVLVRLSGEMTVRRDGAWEPGVVRAREIRVGDETVVRARQPGISAPAAGAVIDAECRAAVAAIISALTAHGLIGT